MPENTTPDSFDAGLAVRTEVMGADFVDAAFERTRGTDSEELQNFVTANVWGSVWTRPGLDRSAKKDCGSLSETLTVSAI